MMLFDGRVPFEQTTLKQTEKGKETDDKRRLMGPNPSTKTLSNAYRKKKRPMITVG